MHTRIFLIFFSLDRPPNIFSGYFLPRFWGKSLAREENIQSFSNLWQVTREKKIHPYFLESM